MIDKLNSIDNQIKIYLLPFKPYYPCFNDDRELFDCIEKDQITYQDLLYKKQQYDLLQQQCFNHQAKIHDYFLSLSIEEEDDVYLQLLNQKEALRQYEFDYMQWQNALKQQQDYIDKNKKVMDELDQMPSVSFRDMNTRMARQNEIIESLNAQKISIQQSLDAKQRELNQLEIYEEELKQVKQRIEEESEKYSLLVSASELFEQAKTSYIAKYHDPLTKVFQEYYQFFTSQEDVPLLIDGRYQLQYEESGMLKDTKLLSFGYQDMVGICMRMALITIMYSDEKPFIILDDPFALLDQNKVQQGLAFLEKMSKQYQIIYFTCHSSRCKSKKNTSFSSLFYKNML